MPPKSIAKHSPCSLLSSRLTYLVSSLKGDLAKLSQYSILSQTYPDGKRSTMLGIIGKMFSLESSWRSPSFNCDQNSPSEPFNISARPSTSQHARHLLYKGISYLG